MLLLSCKFFSDFLGNAKTAALIEGETLHYACGLNIDGSYVSQGMRMNGSTMRFLFIDEAKLMTAGLFGQVYSSLEMHMHDANKFKYDLHAHT